MAAPTRTSDSPFARVQALVRAIPRGRVATYGQLSALVKRRLTPIGVAWALRAARDLPWHRVVNARGGISTEAEAPGVQRARLAAEGVRVGKGGCVDLARYQWRGP
jgi:methylated-DNA-protein-cysteine methyltransferase related protein